LTPIELERVVAKYAVPHCDIYTTTWKQLHRYQPGSLASQYRTIGWFE